MERVIASLKYGRIWKKSALILWIMEVFGLVLAAYSFCYLVGETIDWMGFVLLFVVGMFFVIVSFIFLLKNFLVINKCKKWLQDAMLLNAKAKGIKHPNWIVPEDFGRIKLEITFIYNNKKIKKFSGTKPTNGYSLIFFRFADKDINILYSPKYDEVMILANN